MSSVRLKRFFSQGKTPFLQNDILGRRQDLSDSSVREKHPVFRMTYWGGGNHSALKCRTIPIISERLASLTGGPHVPYPLETKK